MAVLQSIPFFSGTLHAGVTNLPQRSVPLGATSFTITIDRTNWTDPALKLAISIEISLDGGVTWASDSAATYEGGPAPTPTPIQPNPVNQSVLTSDLGDPTNTNRMVRGTLTLTGGNLVTSGSLILSNGV